MFLDVWQDARGIGEFFSNKEVQAQGAKMFTTKEPSIWMPARGSYSYELPPVRGQDKRFVGMIRSPIASPERAIELFSASSAKAARDGRRRGLLSHRTFIKVNMPGDPSPVELLGLPSGAISREWASTIRTRRSWPAWATRSSRPHRRSGSKLRATGPSGEASRADVTKPRASRSPSGTSVTGGADPSASASTGAPISSVAGAHGHEAVRRGLDLRRWLRESSCVTLWIDLASDDAGRLEGPGVRQSRTAGARTRKRPVHALVLLIRRCRREMPPREVDIMVMRWIAPASLLLSVAACEASVPEAMSRADAVNGTNAIPERFQLVEITGAEGVVLKANVVEPGTPGPHPAIVFPSSWGLFDVEYVVQARALAAAGYTVLSYTPRGFWASGGQVETAGPNDVDDARAVLDWLFANTSADPEHTGMAGVSYGAGISLLVSAFDPRVKAVAALSGWTDLVGSLYADDTRRGQTVAMLGLVAEAVGRPQRRAHDRARRLRGEPEHRCGEGVESRALGRDLHLRDQPGRPAILIANAYGDSIFPPNQLVDFTPRSKDQAPRASPRRSRDPRSDRAPRAAE